MSLACAGGSGPALEDDEEALGLSEFWEAMDDKQKHSLLSLRRVSRWRHHPCCSFHDRPPSPTLIMQMIGLYALSLTNATLMIPTLKEVLPERGLCPSCKELLELAIENIESGECAGLHNDVPNDG